MFCICYCIAWSRTCLPMPIDVDVFFFSLSLTQLPDSRIKCIPFTNSLRKRYGHLYWLQNMFELNTQYEATEWIKRLNASSSPSPRSSHQFLYFFSLLTIHAHTDAMPCAMPSNLFLCLRMQKCACQCIESFLSVTTHTHIPPQSPMPTAHCWIVFYLFIRCVCPVSYTRVWLHLLSLLIVFSFRLFLFILIHFGSDGASSCGLPKCPHILASYNSICS